MKKKLVIVESPAKARTLAKILGKAYNLKASLGHIRDLPRSRLGVEVENDFAPKYVIPKEKKKTVEELKEAVKTASTVYLATDPDREGEAISWHLREVTRTNKIPYRRVIFHEITEDAIKHAFQHPHSINMKLVNSQQARRILDRLVGYKISPLLWSKVKRGLSAGRVQSVAVKIIVDREREIQQFVKEEYWTIEAELARKAAPAGEAAFRATLVGLADGPKLDIPDEKKANELKDELAEASYKVAKASTKKASRQPAPPFITSTLQQEAWRRLRFTAKQTMSIAQQLYEGLPIGDEGHIGLITYMRTDSTRVAHSAIAEAREFISHKYGTEYLPPHARSFTTTVKGAQEAHEAIRPTKIWREPSLVKPHLNQNQSKLYQLIWQRMVASQMAAAVFDNTTVDIAARCPYSRNSYLFRASSSINRFPGFTILYTEEKDESDKEPKKAPLPQLAKGDALRLLGLFLEQRFTQPPPRFTEASLVKMLEQEGIGRPSTYAPILSTIQDRGYVEKVKGSFQPTQLGIVVNDLLTQYFPTIINIHFTARMEDELDEIARENRDWVHTIQEFYQPFERSLENASRLMDKVKLPDELTEEVCPQCGKPLAIKSGRYGKFLACTGYPNCKYTKSYQIKTGAKCPQCGAELIQKINKRKRTFYGCSNYPECQFATNFKPIPEPCPQCGGLLTSYRTAQAKCIACGHKIKLEEPKAENLPAEKAAVKG